MKRAAIDRLSVVIPAHDASRTLAACVESVLASSRAPDEVIIVDDASTDATHEIARALIAEHGSRVSMLSLATNRGPAAARNAGARAARADAYFFLDADTELAPEALARFCRRLVDADAVCGVYSAEPLSRGMVPRYKAMLDHFHFARRGVAEYDGFSGYCAGVRASAFAAVGGFDERLRAGDDWENEDFGYRLAEAHRTILDPSIEARHHFPGAGQLARTYFVRVSQWAALFVTRRRFESAGDATGGTALATLAVPLALACVPLAMVWPPAWAVALGLAGVWLWGYAPFFVWVARRDPASVPACIVLNVAFDVVISAGAVWGVLAAMRGAGAATTTSASTSRSAARDV